MEEESVINFKALRAKFQEEALLVQSKSTRPAVAEKPKYLPPAGGHCSSVVNSINIATENKTTVVPRVIFRDGLRASGGKRPISFPPQPQQISPSSRSTDGDTTTRQSLRERHMPQVLPILPGKEHTCDPQPKKETQTEPETVKEVPQAKLKKKNLLLPFKSKVSKINTESGEEHTYAELTTRPSSAPGELPSVEKQTSGDGVLLQGDQSTTECRLSSPDVSVSPPSAETSVDSENRIISTLERAKKKFSCKQMLISNRSKSLRSPDFVSHDRAFFSPPKNMEYVKSDLPSPPPVCLPPLACISARPFSRVNSSVRKPAVIKQCGREKNDPPPATTTLPAHSAPPKKPLPDLRSLAVKPLKPPRPPLLDLSCYRQPPDVLRDPVQEPSDAPQSEHPSVSNAVLDAPDFPDFENSAMEPIQPETVDIAALDLGVLDFGALDPPPPAPTDCGAPPSDACNPTGASESPLIQDLKLGGLNGTPHEPGSFAEPSNLTESIAQDPWRDDATVPPRLVDTELSVAEETAPAFQEAPGSDETHTHASEQDYKCDNVYEDVENLNKLIFCQNSRKQKVNLKNPYADNHPVKEEASLNIWPRNPWGAVPGEHSSLNHVHSKERQSPNTADCKEQKKREKQRLEKEKKEQKEREKKENEMKKKFKVTGAEEPMYHAKVMVASKVRKNDLPVKSGDTVSIIRTTNCPKGKWLARDASNRYGYISVMNVELNIKEMLQLGKKAQAAGRGGNLEGDTISIGSRSSSHPVLTSSFTDDSEEWACEDETLSPTHESRFLQQTSMPETSCDLASTQHILNDANMEDLHIQTRHEALQKLAIFFQHNQDEFVDVPVDNGVPTPTNADPPSFLCAVDEPPYPEQEVDFSELELLPPPPLYADTF
uniref:uncharacterized protein si:ch211-188c16.1 isoform X2 n=1 Tax=Doryrhamphus excisus TaxID=161450 RepID=UPI0025ADC5F4|nr:uncharacterized protein si:ch211-188c16.1 isoform X2 [Doryrhamphus excisus]